MSRTMEVLAYHPKMQARVRAEVVEARERLGDLDYNDLINLPILDAVVRETMRM